MLPKDNTRSLGCMTVDDPEGRPARAPLPVGTRFTILNDCEGPHGIS
jgi:hypothetical protein